MAPPGGGRDERPALDDAAVVAVNAHRWLKCVAVIAGSAMTLLESLDQLRRDDVEALLQAIVRQAAELEEGFVGAVHGWTAAADSATVDLRQGAVLAKCTCGWMSSPSLTAAMAGDEWDEHVGGGVVDLTERHDVAYGLTTWPVAGPIDHRRWDEG